MGIAVSRVEVDTTTPWARHLCGPKDGQLGRGKIMCDYSLMGMPNRLAGEGEVLVTHRFLTGSLGFASPSDLCKTARPLLARSRGFWSILKENLFNARRTNTVAAVCIPPGG